MVLQIYTATTNMWRVSENKGTPKSSIFIGFSIINHPFWGTPIFGNTHVKGHVFHKIQPKGLEHLEDRWRNSNVLAYHGPEN